MAWFEFLKPLGDIVAEPIRGYNERKAIEKQAEADVVVLNAQAKVAEAQTRLRLAEDGQKVEADYDAKAQAQMEHTWKDEYLLFILTLPIIGSFIPGVQESVVVGWEYVAKAPEWYIVSFLGLVAATFGLRWLIRPLIEKMGRK
jgi:hypothetical protein